LTEKSEENYTDNNVKTFPQKERSVKWQGAIMAAVFQDSQHEQSEHCESGKRE